MGFSDRRSVQHCVDSSCLGVSDGLLAGLGKLLPVRKCTGREQGRRSAMCVGLVNHFCLGMGQGCEAPLYCTVGRVKQRQKQGQSWSCSDGVVVNATHP